MIFQQVKEMLVKRQYAEINSTVYQQLLDSIYNGVKAYSFGESFEDAFSQDYVELRDWVYIRVAKDIIYQDSGYLNDHFCIGTIYGMLRVCDDQIDCGNVWYDIYNKILTKE